MTVFTGASAAVAFVLILLWLKSQQKEIAVLFAIGGTVFLFSLTMGQTGEALSVIRDIAKESKYTEEVETMIKALGITAAAQITADICRGAGETVIASQIELVGKVEILALSLPLVARLLILAASFLA